jgi:23S rRNA pseudouridine2605 synthase/23S rRNA pseudouridine2604 synthase
MNKPRWIVTTCSQNDERSILDIMNIKERIFPIWRLDKETTGLILLTNDGRLANYLMHPRYEHEKEYIVETFWSISDKQLEQMEKWVFILWSYTKKAEIKRISSWKFSIVITEWRNRQIRRMVEKVWSRVKKLKRIRIENIVLWNLKFGEYKHLSKWEIGELFERIGIKK